MIKLAKTYIFCDKTFTPTSNPKKAKLTKNCPKLVNNPQNTPFLEVDPKKSFFLQNVSIHQYEQRKKFCSKTKTKNFKIYRMLLALKMRNSPGRENQVGTKSMGFAMDPQYLSHYRWLR